MSRTHAASSRTSTGRKAWQLPRGYTATLLIMFYGAAVGVLVVGAGLAVLGTEGVKTAAPETSAAAKEGAHERGLAGSQADIGIRTRNFGNLKLGIEARVTMNQSRAALSQAKVEAHLDMVQMPGAHSQGPLQLSPTDQPGVYRTVATVAMIGDYEVRVVMHEPVHAEEKKVVAVGVVPGGK